MESAYCFYVTEVFEDMQDFQNQKRSDFANGEYVLLKKEGLHYLKKKKLRLPGKSIFIPVLEDKCTYMAGQNNCIVFHTKQSLRYQYLKSKKK